MPSIEVSRAKALKAADAVLDYCEQLLLPQGPNTDEGEPTPLSLVIQCVHEWIESLDECSIPTGLIQSWEDFQYDLHRHADPGPAIISGTGLATGLKRLYEVEGHANRIAEARGAYRRPTATPMVARDVRPPNDARDRWLYEQALQGKAYAAIKAELAKIATENGWDSVDNVSSISAAIARHIDRHELPALTPRKRSNRTTKRAK